MSTDGEQKIVVLSAMSGTTNTLVEISDYLYKKNPEGANEIINKLEVKYKQHIDELFATQEYKQKGLEVVKSHFDYIRSYTKDLFTLFEEKVVLAQGELISTAMVNFYLQECGVGFLHRSKPTRLLLRSEVDAPERSCQQYAGRYYAYRRYLSRS